ncbi:alpha-ketoacid dehydrogenase subunit beta [soil metagenome]
MSAPERGGTTTYLESIRQGLWEEMEADERVFVLGEDVGDYGGAFKVTDGFLDRFGEARVIDTPISEGAIVGAAVGAAMMGLKPVAEMQFIDFISCAFDQLTNVAAKSRYRWGAGVPIVVRGPSGGGVHGGPFHSLQAESYFANTAGLKIVCPATPYDAKGLIKAAIRDDDPVIFQEHKYLYRRIKEDLPEDDFVVPLGKARIARTGADASILTWAAMVHVALEAAEVLADDGVEVEVVDLRTLVPLDEEAVLKSVAKTGRAIVLHEAPRTGGFGGEIVATIAEKAFEYIEAPIVRVTAPDTPVPYSPPLEEFYLPGSDDVVQMVKRIVDY